MLIKKIVIFNLILILLTITVTAFADCTTTRTTCTEPGGTRYFEGVPVTLDCWQYTEDQKCDAPADNNCDALRNQGCTEISAKCRTMLGDICAVQDETYSCPTENCSASDGIVCGGQFFCMNGDCSSHVPVQNKNFDQAVSAMAGVSSSAESVKKSNGVSAFTGQSMSCRKVGFGSFNNCCNNSGWGHDMGLAHCNDEEKQLGNDKEQGRVVYVGTECDKHYPWPLHGCMKSHEVYCVFPSKMAYLIQTQGRRNQLHIGSGSGDHPNCRGITPDELSKIDFSKIDFSSMYNQIEGNTDFPDDNDTENKIAQRVKDFYDHNQNH